VFSAIAYIYSHTMSGLTPEGTHAYSSMMQPLSSSLVE